MLKVHGPSTVSQIVERTDQAGANASHHLKVPAESGLVEPAPELGRDQRERWWRQAGLVRASWAMPEEQREKWSAATFSADRWLQLTPAELTELRSRVIELIDEYAARPAAPDREPVFVFAHGVPARP